MQNRRLPSYDKPNRSLEKEYVKQSFTSALCTKWLLLRLKPTILWLQLLHQAMTPYKWKDKISIILLVVLISSASNSTFPICTLFFYEEIGILISFTVYGHVIWLSCCNFYDKACGSYECCAIVLIASFTLLNFSCLITFFLFP